MSSWPEIKGEFEDKRFEEGFKFILSHFEHQIQIWPRTISSALTDNKQVPIYYDERYALARFKQANLVDCRISGYPLYTEYRGIVRHTPNFLFIDLDLDNVVPFGNWSSKRLLDMALDNTLRKIKQTFGKGVEPTVLWTGNGYHNYLPIQPLPIPLESDTMFSMFSGPSQSFLRFLEWYLSDGKCDPAHNTTVSFRNCMVRIPGSFNSKYLEAAGKSLEESQVKSVQKWNGYRPKMPIEVLTDFKAYLASLKIMELEKKQTQRQQPRYQPRGKYYQYYSSNSNSIPWIEVLLQKAINDYRKYAIRTIIAPYLTTIKGLDYNQSFEIISNWLYNKCDRLQKLNSPHSVFDYKIKEALNLSISKNWRPVGLDKVKREHPQLYSMIRAT
jgi:Primase X